jgi:RNA polymerase sigma factor (sigma-70 family)
MLDKKQSELISGCRLNDRTAQEQLYKLFYHEMFKICCRYLRSEALAKDAVNNAFLKIFKSIEQFDEDKGELGGWIRTIMIRTCIDIKRTELRFSAYVVSNSTEEAFIEPSILSKLYAEDLLKYVRQLPQASQIVFNLAVFDGFSHQEIAEQLQIGENTSRWHLSEAKKKLRTLIHAHHGPKNDQSPEVKSRKS